MKSHISRRVWAISWFCVAILVISAGVDVMKLRESVLHEKTSQTRQLVETVHGVLAHYQQQVAAGAIDIKTAQRTSREIIRNLRYDQNEYFWINDRSKPFPHMVMHPTQPQLEGKILDSNEYNTATHFQYGDSGKFQPTTEKTNSFSVFNQVIDAAGQGFVRYEWVRPLQDSLTQKPIPKLSYVRLFEPWDWVIGTGIYIDDIDYLVKRQMEYLLARTLGVGIILLGFTLLVVRGIKRIENNLVDQRKQMQALINATTESVLLLDSNGLIKALNQLAAQRFQRLPNEILGANFFDMLSPTLAETRKAACQEVIRTGEPMVIRDERNGISFENSIYPVSNQQGDITSVAVYAKDITDQQRAASTEELFRHLDTVVLKWQMGSVAVAQIFCDGLLPIFHLSGAWISKAEKDGRLTLLAFSESVSEPFIDIQQLPQHWHCTANAGCKEQCPHQWPKSCVAIQQGKKYLTQVTGQAPTSHLSAASNAGIEAALALPIMLQDHKWGVVTVYAKQREHLEKAQRSLTAITNRLAAILESSLQQERAALVNAAFAEIHSAIFIVDSRTQIIWTNSLFNRLTGYTGEALIELALDNLLDSSIEQFQPIQVAVASQQSWAGQCHILRHDGKTLNCSLNIKPLVNSDSQPAHFIGIIDTWLDD